MEPDAHEGFLNQTMDVLSLPGAYLSDSSVGHALSNDDLTEALVVALASKERAEKGYDSLWQGKKAHTLSRVNSAETLFQLADDLRKSWRDTWRAQEVWWRGYITRQGYPTRYITSYSKYGLLPRLLLKTYEYYYDLLNEAHALLHNEEGRLQWKGGRCEAVMEYHSRKLRSVRSLAPCYIDHIIQSYVFLRDTADKDF